MCGIVGAIADRDVVPVLIEGLKRLEYRGYDSAGIAVVDGDARAPRAPDRPRGRKWSRPRQAEHFTASLGIGHTRWATHGGVTEANAHPHISHGDLALVHNGIIENHEAAARAPAALGYAFESQTDTEVVAHLIHHYRSARRRLAGRAAAGGQGTGRRVCAGGDRQARPGHHGRRAHGLPVAGGPGRGRELHRLGRVGDHVGDAQGHLPGRGRHRSLTRDDVRVFDADDKLVQRDVHMSDVSLASLELGPYRHFMQKEIHEQPRAIGDTIEGIIDAGGFDPALFGANAEAVLARHRMRADPRLRHQLLRRPDRALLAGGHRRHPVRGRYRQRVPLSQGGGQPEATDRHHLAVRRDPGHDGSAEIRQVAGAGAHAVDLQRAGKRHPARQRAGVLHPRRRRDRGGLDQGVHHRSWSRCSR